MIATMLVVPAINVSADAMDITDYVPVQNGTYLDGKITKITSYNGTNYDYGVEINELEDNIFEFYTKDTRATVPSAVTRPQGGLQYDLNNKPITKGDKYVFVIKVRKVNESDVVPNLVFGIADAAMGGKDAGWGWKAQTVYACDITSTEWQTVVQEIEIPYNGTANTCAILGLGAGCTHDSYKGKTEYEFRPGAAVEIDMDSLYLGSLSAYDMTFELSSSDACVGETLTGTASVVDRAGQSADYDQSFTYYVTDEEGYVAEGFEITEPNEGEVEIKAGAAVTPGNYVVLAVSDVYEGFQKALPISIAYGDTTDADGKSIKVISDGDTVVGLTNKITFTASVEKDGEVVDYTEAFTWSAVNSDKMTVCDSITLTPSEDTKSAELSLEMSTPEATYYIMVTSGSMNTLFEITVDKSGDIENITSQITEKKETELSDGMETYLAVLELSDSLAASADASSLAKVLTETSKDEDITEYDTAKLKEYFVKCAVVSLYSKNENAVSLYDEEGRFEYAQELNLSEMDKDAVTIWKLFGNDEAAEDALISKEGRLALQKSITDSGIYNAYDFADKVKENILLYTLAYPDVMGFGYVETVLTEENLGAVGIDTEDYIALADKSSANESVAGTLYTLAELEEALKDASEEEEEIKPSGSSRPSGGGGGFVGSYTSPKKDKDEEKEVIDIDTVFDDVPSNHWACGDIYFLRELGVVNGVNDTSFDPDGVVTREQFLKMLVTAFKVSASGADAAFTDVDNSAWYAPYVKIGLGSGIINGMSDGSFGVGKAVTRQDACVMLVRALGLDTSAEATLFFADADKIAPYAKNSVGALSEYSIINGFTDNTFRGTEVCSRAQAAKIISGAITIYNAIISGGGNK